MALTGTVTAKTPRWKRNTPSAAVEVQGLAEATARGRMRATGEVVGELGTSATPRRRRRSTAEVVVEGAVVLTSLRRRRRATAAVAFNGIVDVYAGDARVLSDGTPRVLSDGTPREITTYLGAHRRRRSAPDSVVGEGAVAATALALRTRILSDGTIRALSDGTVRVLVE